MKRVVVFLLSLLILTGCSSPLGVLGPGTRTITTSPPPSLPPTQSSGAAEVLTLQMIDGDHGWAVTRGGVLRTEDGGSTWSQSGPSGAAFDLPGPFFFLDAMTAWVISAEVPSRLFRTTDGGATWQAASAGDLRFLSFADAMHGWGMTRDNGATGGQELVTIYSTTDGGKTWETMARAGIPGTALNNFPLTGVKNGLAFRDAQTGWAAGYLTNLERPWLYATTDAGKTWSEQSLTLPKPLQGRFVVTDPPQFFGNEEAILPVWSIHADDDRPAAVFLHSNDGGKTWQVTSVIRNEATWKPVYFFLNPAQGWLADGKKLYVTKDGGETWQVKSPEVALENVRSLDFVSPETGWAVLGGDQPRVLKTSDGGSTWVPVPVSPNR